MLTNAASRTLLSVALLLACVCCSLGSEEVKSTPSSEDLFRNPNFEAGKALWTLDVTGKTMLDLLWTMVMRLMVAIAP